jgi:hypothetical protein
MFVLNPAIVCAYTNNAFVPNAKQTAREHPSLPSLDVLISFVFRRSICMSWHYYWTSPGSSKGFHSLLGNCVGSDHASNRHEESGQASELCTGNWFSDDLTYPKVAPDPSIYCPSVLITPFGPAPYLMMLTEPGGKLEGLSIVQWRHACASYRI